MTTVVDEELASLLSRLDESIPDSKQGLPEEVFRLISRLTPLINVDLLVRDKVGRVLLTWRDDEFYGPGWHVPGGIIRFKETAAARIAAVARNEFGAEVIADDKPCLVSEVRSSYRDIRGHFISLLYPCQIKSPLDSELDATHVSPQNGMWRWHTICPSNLIEQHEIYREIIDDKKSSSLEAVK